MYVLLHSGVITKLFKDGRSVLLITLCLRHSLIHLLLNTSIHLSFIQPILNIYSLIHPLLNTSIHLSFIRPILNIYSFIHPLFNTSIHVTFIRPVLNIYSLNNPILNTSILSSCIQQINLFISLFVSLSIVKQPIFIDKQVVLL